MNDRELTELAAKAAGCYDLGEWDDKWNCLTNYEGWTFDPLTDDGDALRLAVDLSLTVFTGGVGCVSVSGWIVCGVDAKPIGLTEHYGSSGKYAATRRAIVLAAAEIGRRKK